MLLNILVLVITVPHIVHILVLKNDHALLKYCCKLFTYVESLCVLTAQWCVSTTQYSCVKRKKINLLIKDINYLLIRIHCIRLFSRLSNNFFLGGGGVATITFNLQKYTKRRNDMIRYILSLEMTYLYLSPFLPFLRHAKNLRFYIR